MNFSGGFWSESGVVNPDSSKIIQLPETGDVSAALIPAAGGSALLQVTISPEEEIAADTAEWFDWPKGEVESRTLAHLPGPIRAIRISAVLASCKYNLLNRRA